MGVEAAWCALAVRPAEHSGLLQHETLHAADSRRAPGSLVLTHHEALEEDELAERQAGTQRLPALLLARPVQYVFRTHRESTVSLLFKKELCHSSNSLVM